MDLRNYHVFQVSSYRGPTKVTLATYNPIISDVEKMCAAEGIKFSVFSQGKDQRVIMHVEKSWLEARSDKAATEEHEALEKILASVKILEDRQNKQNVA